MDLRAALAFAGLVRISGLWRLRRSHSCPAGPAHVHLGYLPGEASAPVRSPRQQLFETLRDYLEKKTPTHTVGCIIYIF